MQPPKRWNPPPDVMMVCRLVKAAGGRALLVGGCVRDWLAGHSPGDYDVEVFGVGADRLVEVLSADFRLNEVGRSFGVLKLGGTAIDVSLPRRDSVVQRRLDARENPHTAFRVETDPSMPVRDAAARRDFTINAILHDPISGEWIDPFDGRRDLEAKTLRHTSEAHFAEDPLRVLRAMQFVARFDLDVDAETVRICRTISLRGLSKERVFDEWEKLILRGRRIARGLEFLKSCDHLADFPELDALVGCAQDAKWHPEGDVWVHTLHALDFFANHRIGDEKEDLVVGFAVLCHDLGKPATTSREAGRIRSPGHANVSVGLTEQFLGRMTDRRDLISEIVPLVKYHGMPRDFYDIDASDAAIRRLARKVGRIDRLARVSLCDSMARPPISDLAAQEEVHGWLIRRARELDVVDSAPDPILLGRHVLELGVAPGPLVGRVLRACYDMQLDGQIATLEEARRAAEELVVRFQADDEA